MTFQKGRTGPDNFPGLFALRDLRLPSPRRVVPVRLFTILFLLVSNLLASASDCRAAEIPDHSGEEVLLLDAAIERAISNNPSLAEMQARYQALAEIPSQKGALPDPVLSLNALNLPTDSFDLDQEAMTQMQIGISQSFPFPGKLDLLEGASQYEAEAAGHSVDELRLRLVAKVKSGWWQLYYLDRSLEIIDSNQELFRQFIQVARTKYEVGEGLQQDVLLAQLELSKLIDQKIKLLAVRREQAIQLNVLMDAMPNAPVVLPRSVSTHMPDVADESILYERAELARPLLKEMESNVKAAESRRDLAEKGSYPDFKLGVAYGNRSGDNPPPVGGSRSDLLSVMFSVNLPIYSGSKQSKAVNQRAHELRKNRYALQDKKGATRSDISSATSDYRRATEQFSLFKAGIIPQAQQTVSSMLAGYQVNEVDFLNLVGSQATLLNYQVQYWGALTAANQALARLVAAIGAENIYE